jgi:hypothetical protein
LRNRRRGLSVRRNPRQLTASLAAPALPPVALGLLVFVLGGVGLVLLRGRPRDLARSGLLRSARDHGTVL